LLVASGVRGAGLPPETAARLASALDSLQSPAVAGYTMTVKVTVAKPNGSDREDHLEVMKATRAADGTLVHEVVRSLENGKDVTEKRRAEQSKREKRGDGEATEKKGSDEKEGGISASLRLPLGDDARLFAFSPAASGGPYAVAFAPLPGHAEDDGLARGTLAWDPATLDPLWLEAEPVIMPDHVSAMKMRFEFARAGELVYPRRTITDGTGGFLWIKRTFHMDMVVADVVAAHPAP
jgi:hypothetical protein